MKHKSFYLFALFDLIIFAEYVVSQISHNHIPFLSDFKKIQHTADIWTAGAGGEWFIYLLILPTYLLLFSLPVSIWLYIQQSKHIKWFALLQTPLRIWGLIPTIPFFMSLLNLAKSSFDSHIFSSTQIIWAITIYLIIALIEISKNIYLYRK